jgi:hypothetical protein
MAYMPLGAAAANYFFFVYGDGFPVVFYVGFKLIYSLSFFRGLGSLLKFSY